MSEPPRRVRVTARSRRAPTRPIALAGARVDEADAVFARALRRAQLGLALGTVTGFVVVVAVLGAAIALIPELDEIAVLGVPLSWLLHAFAFYPAILAFALVYQRGAARNERRYRQLRGTE
ncbi:hypothetical protein [Microbacterium sp. No. 7]|uniref:hypothetical protein n=1 Tax=Microbacterium sp. No. 7 TaxID=1714373 RepID=UPI0006CF6430|nr:hypothetical protein [Microbacterium sp. No. 7]ALJ22251.1 heavy metal transporter [Microbacterium sp. No. 7]